MPVKKISVPHYHHAPGINRFISKCSSYHECNHHTTTLYTFGRMLLIVATVKSYIICCCKNQQGCNVAVCVICGCAPTLPENNHSPSFFCKHTQKHIYALSPKTHTHIFLLPQTTHVLLLFRAASITPICLCSFFFPLVTFSFIPSLSFAFFNCHDPTT